MMRMGHTDRQSVWLIWIINSYGSSIHEKVKDILVLSLRCWVSQQKYWAQSNCLKGVARYTQQQCWCTQQLCEWAKLPLFKKCEYLHTEKGSFIVVIFNYGRTFFRAISWKNARSHGRRFFRCSRKNLPLLLFSTAEEPSPMS